MKRHILLMVVLLFVSNILFAGVAKKSKSTITFKGFGTYTLTQTEKIIVDKKRVESDNNFKGQGIMGKLAGKLLFSSAQQGEIIDLPAMTIFQMDFKKKEYRKSSITKISEEDMKAGEPSNEEEETKDDQESDIRIIRSEFKVEATGEAKTINNFACKKYLVTSITEWENVKTGEKGTEKLFTELWTTPMTADLKAAQDEENQFSKAYLEKIGLDMDDLQQSVLGTHWLSILKSLDRNNQQPTQDEAKVAVEMRKIEGYPIVVDGKYFSERPAEQKQQEEEKQQDITDVKNVFGGFMKKAIKKEEKTEPEPNLSFYTEVIELSKTTVDEADFKVPANFKFKGE